MSEEIRVIAKPMHKWVAVSTYELTEEQAQESLGGAPVPLTAEMLHGTVGPVCLNCEQHYGNHDQNCQAKVLSN